MCVTLYNLNNLRDNMRYIEPDKSFIFETFENRQPPLDRDVVTTQMVASYIRAKLALNPTNDRIGKLLCSKNIGGQPKQIRLGSEIMRVIILRNHGFWFSSSGRAIAAELWGTAEEQLPDENREVYRYLLKAFESRSEPLMRDTVLVSSVADNVRRNMDSKPSNITVGKTLAGYPFYGKPRQVRIGDQLYRVIVLRNHDRWLLAPGREVMDHIAGNRPAEELNHQDPLLD